MSHTALSSLQMSYFGKVSSRGDFVKGAYNPQMLGALDAWLSQAMELLAEDARWKLIYDNAAPLHFACLGSRSRLAIAGHVRASRDESSRRYPFMVAVPFDVEDGADLMVGAVALLQPFWETSARKVDGVLAAADPEVELKGLEATPLEFETVFRGSEAQRAYSSFIGRTSLLHIEQLLNFEGHQVSMRRLVLALGLLLQPVMTSMVSHLEKGLTLPLPRDNSLQPLVATFWLDIVSQFFTKADFELLLCITQVNGRPRLVIGFGGLSPKTLHSVIHPQVYAEQNIDVDNPEWVEDSVHSNYAMYKLVSYLEQAQLPLEIVRTAFREVFIGE